MRLPLELVGENDFQFVDDLIECGADIKLVNLSICDPTIANYLKSKLN